MSKHTLITLLGLFVALVPFLGFPGAWKTFFIVLSGLVIAFLVLTIIARKRNKIKNFDTHQGHESTSHIHHDNDEDTFAYEDNK